MFTGEKWTLMKNISVTEYLNYEGTQFSKSRGVGVFGNDAQETGIPVEVCLAFSASCPSPSAFSADCWLPCKLSPFAFP